MRLKQIAEDFMQYRIDKQKKTAETTKQRDAYLKSVQAWYQLRRVQAEELRARQRFIQAAVASASSQDQP